MGVKARRDVLRRTSSAIALSLGRSDAAVLCDDRCRTQRPARRGIFQQNSVGPLGPTPFKRRRCWASAVLASVAVGLVAPVRAQTITWVGGTGQDQWGNKNNWSPKGEPSASSIAVFPSTADSLTPFVNIPNAMASALEFNTPGYTINVTSGKSVLTISGAGIIGSNPTPTINVNAGAGDLVQFTGSATAGGARFNLAAGDTARLFARLHWRDGDLQYRFRRNS